MVELYLSCLVRLTEGARTLHRRTAGQGLVEYSLLIAFLVIVVVGILTLVGRTLCTTWYVKLVDISAWGSSTSVDNPCP